MNWLYAVIGTISGGTIIFFIWWMVHIGKTIKANEELSKRLTAGEIVARKKNKYIKDVDALAAKSKEYDEKIHQVFASGATLDGVVSLLKSIDKPDNSKAKPDKGTN